MNKDVVLSRAGEQLIECTILYPGMSSDGLVRACFDKEGTRYLTYEELKNAYFSRCVVYIEGYYVSVECLFDYSTYSIIEINISADGSQHLRLFSAEYVKS